MTKMHVIYINFEELAAPLFSHITFKSYGYFILEWHSFQMKYGLVLS